MELDKANMKIGFTKLLLANQNGFPKFFWTVAWKNTFYKFYMLFWHTYRLFLG